MERPERVFENFVVEFRYRLLSIETVAIVASMDGNLWTVMRA
jgi:hypothetical protein